MEPDSEIWGVKDEYTKMASVAKEAPAVWLRKEFKAPAAIRRATAGIRGLGFFELYINGQWISSHALDRSNRGEANSPGCNMRGD